ncbi:MAG TPA: glycoside hydrolase family 38 C-terminal domain-containing protein, partial [Candidatus Izemoplasmatales bacterium]|nr:glycoside hydrolase family 38 C-terminal domain-containing protein [Candidatus Izemoplasmatales bacterium]
MKTIAHCIHHTHWDPIWYFNTEDALVQLSYNMKELLNWLEEGRIQTFFFDGQTAAIEDYLRTHPEDRKRIAREVRSGRLVIGPFHSQLDCFISSGESVWQNLRLGIQFAKTLGKTSRIAYLPDSFGHSQDFPMVFRHFGIRDFVITRGVGDDYGVGNEFCWRSPDGSEVLVAVMTAGYGYGTYPFKDGTFFNEKASDYNLRKIRPLMDRLLEKSSLPGEFVLPLGFDQNPAIPDIERRMAEYNASQDEIEFRETTWKDFLGRVRQQNHSLPVYLGELNSPQYHRIHRSVFSARADIKTIQDRTERLLTYIVQPMMAAMTGLGVPWDQGLLDRAWELLIRSQTHASATMTDDTNAFVKTQSLTALHLGEAMQGYLVKLISLSISPRSEKVMPLVLFSTLPDQEPRMEPLEIYSSSPIFALKDGEEEIPYTVIRSEIREGGVARRRPEDREPNRRYFVTTILPGILPRAGIGYRVVDILDGIAPNFAKRAKTFSTPRIENEFYRVEKTLLGISIQDKKNNLLHERALYWEESGDEGDNYDYSPPESDWVLMDDLSSAALQGGFADERGSEMILRGTILVPKDLESRSEKRADVEMEYEIRINLGENDPVIYLNGKIQNKAKNHRVRLVFSGSGPQTRSIAATQYGIIERPTRDAMIDHWKEAGWFEEPSPTFPLLHFVSSQAPGNVLTIFTGGPKEYEFIGDETEDIAVTLFRSVGHMGLPDLSRRPGRPSGLDFKIIETPQSQMIGEFSWSLGLSYEREMDPNRVWKHYIRYAAPMACFQRQSFDKTVTNIAYFPTNPWKNVFPTHFDWLHWEGSPAVFGSVTAMEDGNG